MESTNDFDLWHDYLRELKQVFTATEEPKQSDESEESKVSEDFGDWDESDVTNQARDSEEDPRVYTAPLTSIGISIGRSIDQQIVNHDLFRIGDLLLPVNSPIFMPGPSYSQRLLRYLMAAQVAPGRQDAESLKALNDANAALATQTDTFLTSRRQAYTLYQQDPEFDKISFDDWVKEYYPPYAQAQLSKNAASQLAYQASQNYYGAETDQLWNDKVKVSKAHSEVACPTYNMPTSVAQVTQREVVGQSNASPVNPADIKYEPRYSIDSTFTNIVNNWVLNAFNGHNKPFIMKFKSGGGPINGADGFNGDFMDIGFPKKIKLEKDKVLPILPLFTTSYDEKPDTGETLSSVSITIQASDASVFAVSPDQSWNIPDVASRYNLSPTASPDLFEPLVLVSNVLLGYMVSITIQTDSTFCSTINERLTKAQKLNGTATLFGLNIGSEPSASVVGFDQIQWNKEAGTIMIPPRDNSQLTLLGLMGRKLKTSPRSAGNLTN